MPSSENYLTNKIYAETLFYGHQTYTFRKAGLVTRGESHLSVEAQTGDITLTFCGPQGVNEEGEENGDIVLCYRPVDRDDWGTLKLTGHRCVDEPSKFQDRKPNITFDKDTIRMTHETYSHIGNMETHLEIPNDTQLERLKRIPHGAITLGLVGYDPRAGSSDEQLSVFAPSDSTFEGTTHAFNDMTEFTDNLGGLEAILGQKIDTYSINEDHVDR